MKTKAQAKKELAQYLKKSREEAELSQRKVSEKLGYTTPQFVSNWERAIIAPPMDTIAYLILLYGMSAKEVERLLAAIVEASLRESIERVSKRMKGRAPIAKAG